jgi:hypothetical protein
MVTAAEKLNILIIQHLEHVGVDAAVVAPLKAGLEKGTKPEGSTLYELFCSATGEGMPPKQKQQMQQQPMQQQQKQQPPGRMPAQGGAPTQQAPAARNAMQGSYNGQQAAMPTQQILPPAKPVIAKEPEQRNPKLDEQLMTAAKSGAVDTIPGLINSGAYVNHQDKAGTTPLLAATEADKIDVIKVLLQNGADVNLARQDGTSPLLCAYKGNKKKSLKELTAGAFQTLNRAVNQTGNIGGGMMYDPGEDEGVTHMDICQAHDETAKLFKLQAHRPEVPVAKPEVTRKESMVNIGGADMGDLRAGGVRLLMQELSSAGRKVN